MEQCNNEAWRIEANNEFQNLLKNIDLVKKMQAGMLR